LEVKVKQLDSWKQQLDILRNENNELKDKMMDLEKQVDTLSSRNKLHNNSIVGATPLLRQQEHRSMSLPSSSRNGSSLMKRATTANKRSYSKSNGGEPSLGLKKDSRPLPTPLSHQTGFNNQLYNTNSSTTHRQLHDYNKRRKVAHQQELVIGQAPIQMMADNNADLIIIDRNHETQLMNENDFDPFFHQEELFAIGTNNEFVPTSGGQVLDDLFSMLQTRQRPQIPMLTTFANNQDNSSINLI
jgi:hypothetical protein